jgi:hypothetical protein
LKLRLIACLAVMLSGLGSIALMHGVGAQDAKPSALGDLKGGTYDLSSLASMPLNASANGATQLEPRATPWVCIANQVKALKGRANRCHNARG